MFHSKAGIDIQATKLAFEVVDITSSGICHDYQQASFQVAFAMTYQQATRPDISMCVAASVIKMVMTKTEDKNATCHYYHQLCVGQYSHFKPSINHYHDFLSY